MPQGFLTQLESLSGLDLSDLEVHHDSPKPRQLGALAYAQGTSIHLGPGQEQHLPHEAWHVVQQLQGRVRSSDLEEDGHPINADPQLEAEAQRMGDKVAQASRVSAMRHHRQRVDRVVNVSAPSRQLVQRMVRVNGGSSKVKESDYQRGGAKASVGSPYSVASLIADPVRRIFTNATELEAYANGKTDYIGDVNTSGAGTFWYRLPKSVLTVLGEEHHNPAGYTEDVILGLQTSRFMYEPFNEVVGLAPLKASSSSGTQKRIDQINAGRRVSSMVDTVNFNPNLENIVLKALAGTSLTRNYLIAGDPKTMNAAEVKQWSGRPTTSDYSMGERTALYLSMAIHLTRDLYSSSIGPAKSGEPVFVTSARDLVKLYKANRSVLDILMSTKDGNDLIGIYELSMPPNFPVLPVLRDFTLRFHEYAAAYIVQLGKTTGNAVMSAEGAKIGGSLNISLRGLGKAREEVMWEKIQHAKSNGYLLVGMGDAHRKALLGRLNGAGIRHERIDAALASQRKANDRKWAP